MGFSRSYRHFAQLVAATAIIVSMVACGSERDAIDRTQPNILTKDMFQGEWYFGQTVVDLVAGENPTFTGYQNSLERVRFDIQEEWLYVRRSYERIKNGDIVASQTTSPDDGGVYMGEIIAAYKIQKHFDIQRAYNSTTGEEHNVVEENAVDRPWYEREYMRVDWSINHAKNFNLLLEDTHQEPVAYYVQDANDPDFPVIDAGEFDDDGTMVRAPYLDITNVIMATPGSTYIRRWTRATRPAGSSLTPRSRAVPPPSRSATASSASTRSVSTRARPTWAPSPSTTASSGPSAWSTTPTRTSTGRT